MGHKSGNCLAGMGAEYTVDGYDLLMGIPGIRISRGKYILSMEISIQRLVASTLITRTS